MSFKMCTILSSMMQYHAVLLGPARDVNHPCSPSSSVKQFYAIYNPPASHLVAVCYQTGCQSIASACVQVTLIHFTMVPKLNNRDAGNSEMPKRTCKVFPISEKMKALNLIRKEKKSL